MRREKVKDVIAGVLSIIFISVVFYLYFIEIVHIGVFGYFRDQPTGFVVYESTRHDSCYVNLMNSTIVLRMDDIRAYSVLTKPLVDEILRRNMAVVLGVIPRNLEDDALIINYLLSIRENPNVEIAQHGSHHDESDITISKSTLVEGNKKIQDLLGVLPVTYIPPFNDINDKSKEEISEYFKVISGGEGTFKSGSRVAEMGYTVQTYDYQDKVVVPIDTVISTCNDSLSRTNLCVINLHPQEYGTDINNPDTLSREKFGEFKELLDALETINASTSTFKDIVYCSEEE